MAPNGMQYRPDFTYRTSVIEPWDINVYDPVAVARDTINPFIYGIRAMGPAVAPAMAEAAAAATAVNMTAAAASSGRIATADSQAVTRGSVLASVFATKKAAKAAKAAPAVAPMAVSAPTATAPFGDSYSQIKSLRASGGAPTAYARGLVPKFGLPTMDGQRAIGRAARGLDPGSQVSAMMHGGIPQGAGDVRAMGRSSRDSMPRYGGYLGTPVIDRARVLKGRGIGLTAIFPALALK